MKIPFNYTEKVVSKIAEKLKDDTEYYGEYGKQWLSNSDIKNLLDNPRMFGKPQAETKAMLEGRFFHTAMLEKEKLDDFVLVDVSSRNTKAYKEHISHHDNKMSLLVHEAEALYDVVDAMKCNLEMYDEIYKEGNQYEVPMVKMIMGLNWKGKADIVCQDKLIDLKTTSDINKFRSSAYRYNYDSQAFIYQELFGLPLEFYVIDKSTFQLAIFKPTEEFIERGKEKVENAVFIYNTYFSKDSIENINQFVLHETL